MTLPRRAQMMLGALGMIVLFGIAGLAWWWWHHRPGCQPPRRLRRVRAALVIAGLVIIAVGSVGRLVTVFQSVPACSPPGGEPAARSGSLDVSLVAQEAATWPETGIGLLYSRVKNARVCLSRSAYYYVAPHADNIAGTRAMTLGDIVLTPGFNISREQLQTLVGHEARHRAQWAVATAIAGPFAFPVAYAIVDFFFPGSRNFFERQAGLESGGYRHSGTGPVLGPAQLATLGVLAGIIVMALLGVWHRHVLSRSARDSRD
ncbi:MAG TPA: hypothetical protein VF070_16065 [Streptosporangiaceae bacterium]